MKRVDTAEQKAERENEREREREREKKTTTTRWISGNPGGFNREVPAEKNGEAIRRARDFFPLSARTNDEGSRYGFALLRSSKAVEVGVAMALLCVSVVVLVAVAG